MNPSFGEHAVRLFAVAARLLGWRPDEFWTATPSEFSAALAPPTDAPGIPLARSDLEKMMELENG